MLPLLYGVAVGTGLCAIVFDVAYGAFLPSVVARERLLEANGQLEASNAVARIAGPGLAGVLVQLLSGPSALLLDALSFVVSFGSLLLVRACEERRARAPRQQLSWLHDMGQGVRLVATHALLRPLAVSAALFGFFYTMLLPIYWPSLFPQLHTPPPPL